MATIDYGIGWVHPSAGSDSNNGYGPDTPKATIQNAISAGFQHVRVAAGTHTVSSITTRCMLEFMPGTHTFTNAPVTITRPVNLIASQRRPVSLDGTGSTKITAPGTVSAFFVFEHESAGTGSGNIFGLMIRGLWFDFSKLSSGGGAVEWAYVNQSLMEDCFGYEGSYGGVYLLKDTTVVAGSGPDHSWNRHRRNVSWNGGMFSCAVTGEGLNRTTYMDSVTVYPDGDGAHRAYNNRCIANYGALYEGITVDGVTADCAIYTGRSKKLHVIGCHGANITSGLFMWADQNAGSPRPGPFSSHWVHCLGVNAQGGRIRAADYLPPLDAETYDTTNANRFDIVDAKDNL